MSRNEIDNLNDTIAQALQQLKTEQGDKFSPDKVNLAELSRRTGISRKKLRNAKEHGFKIPVHGNSGRKKDKNVISGFTELIDNQLSKGVTNSSVIFDRLQENGYQGGRMQVKEYIRDNKYLVPAKRSDYSARKSGTEVLFSTRRTAADGLGLCECRQWRRQSLSSSMLCHDVPPLRNALHRILSECKTGEPVHRNDSCISETRYSEDRPD